ncbi:hypothetical protein LXA43DRAFT_664020 [Ganoderma leucocontextum]|nr:hypothetical protein LXA43DRAFT_664020 [Ganoderma leucocontextum]
MVGITSQLEEAGQFTGTTPLTGYNIQGHSVSARLVREVPADVLKTAVTHFGTQGLFGKATRRTTQHDADNVRRKKWRAAKPLKPKPKPKHRFDSDSGRGYLPVGVSEGNAEAPPPVSNAPASGNAAGENVLDLHLPPLPPPSIATSFSPPAHPTYAGEQTLLAECRLFCEKSLYSRPKTLPSALGSVGALALSTVSEGPNSQIPTSSSHFDTPGPAYPWRSSPTTAGLCADGIHPTRIVARLATGPFPECDAPADQGYTPLNTGYVLPVWTSAGHMVDTPLPTEPLRGRGIVDASTSEPGFIWQANTEMHLATRAEQTPNAFAGDGIIVNANTDVPISGTLPTQGQFLREKRPRSRYDAPPDAPMSYHPFARFADPECPSNQVLSPPSDFYAQGAAYPWHSSQATAELYANGIGTTAVAACPATAPSPQRDASPIWQDYTPLNNGYAASMWSSARHEREGLVSPPPTAYPAYSAFPSLAAAFNHYPLGNGMQTRVSTVPSDGLANALIDHYVTSPPSAPYVDDMLLSNEPIGSCRFINASTSAPEVMWPMVPEPHLATVADQTLNGYAFHCGGASVDMNVLANASLPSTDSIESEAHYTHVCEGCLEAYSPL